MGGRQLAAVLVSFDEDAGGVVPEPGSQELPDLLWCVGSGGGDFDSAVPESYRFGCAFVDFESVLAT